MLSARPRSSEDAYDELVILGDMYLTLLQSAVTGAEVAPDDQPPRPYRRAIRSQEGLQDRGGPHVQQQLGICHIAPTRSRAQ
jgi:hypothetical protein